MMDLLIGKRCCEPLIMQETIGQKELLYTSDIVRLILVLIMAN